MRPKLFLPALLVPTLLGPALTAQAPSDPVEVRLASIRANENPTVPAFRWLRPKEHRFQGAWELDPDFSQTVTCRELIGSDFGEGEQAAWAARLGWPVGPHWLLLSPEGEPILDGSDTPDPTKLLDAMRAKGWRPRFERRARFLKEHPDQGDAWCEALYDAGRYAAHRAVVEHRLAAPDPAKDTGLEFDDMDKRPTPPDQDQAQWGPAAEALQNLVKVDGWTRNPHLFLGLVALQVGGAKNSLVLRGPLQEALEGVEDALQAEPSDPRLWEDWGASAFLLPGSDAQPLVDRLTPLTGSPWPPVAAAPYLDFAYSQRKDWIGLEALAGRAYAQAMEPALQLRMGPEATSQALSAWGFSRLHALGEQGRQAEALAFVKDLRAAMGRHWPEQASSVLGPSLAFYLGKEDTIVKALLAAKDQKAPEEAAKPAPPPVLRLSLMGHPAWEREWASYATRSAFDDWDPASELQWQPLKAPEERSLRARMGWGAEPRWVLLRGEVLLASGTKLPTPALLAGRLHAAGEPYLEQLGAFIRAHPDHLEARVTRQRVLRFRMPNERLEATLMEDAQVTLEAFHPWTAGKGPEDWTPRKDLWAPASRRVLPEIEARLRRWPERSQTWAVWLDWNEVSDRPSSPTRLMESLPIWKTRLDGGPGPLPDTVLALVASNLKRQARWADLADWCQAFWEGGVRDEVARLASPGADDPKGKAMGSYLTSLITPYRTALQNLHREAPLLAFDQEIKDLSPSLAKRLTASSIPPRPGR